MGWFWSSTQSSAPEAPPPAAQAHQSEPAQSPSTPRRPPPPPPPPPPADSHDGNADDDAELRKFIALFHEADANEKQQDRTTSTAVQAGDAAAAAAAAPPTHRSSWFAAWSRKNEEDDNGSSSSSSSTVVPTRERSLAEATLPTNMSCRQAFDLAWACQSPAGQWRAVYRHGGVRPCSALWDDFWFCMRIRSFPAGAVRDEAVRSHYRTKELERYYAPGRPSSEDVWRSRTVDEVLPAGSVFSQPFFAVAGEDVQDDGRSGEQSNGNGHGNGHNANDAVATGVDDASRMVADMERRHKIRQQMGYNT
ncbi:hypothetical protein SPI_01729 [Niveomyces insectorum RCEF 264]|uniref:Uncharacterized protein n=1 Tax=Niveomyces insectorum RCEF 264 TaxID=1081102 RepID=A0A167Z6D9_9HYPO|nr:hypothetical protein SPI_01729 [Niveomyces insectorum RCEF 264]